MLSVALWIIAKNLFTTKAQSSQSKKIKSIYFEIDETIETEIDLDRFREFYSIKKSGNIIRLKLK